MKTALSSGRLGPPDRAIMLPTGKIVFRLRGVVRHDLAAVCHELAPAIVAKMLAEIGDVNDLTSRERFALL